MRLSGSSLFILLLSFTGLVACSKHHDESSTCQSQMAAKFSEFKSTQNQWYGSHNSQLPLEADQSQFIAGTNGHVDLLIHGFTSSPRAMEDLAAALASRGDTVIVPLLTGFGIDGAAANQSTAADWSAVVDKGLNIGSTCGSPVSVISHSLGGALVSDAVYNRGATGIDRLVFLAPFYKVADPKIAYMANMLASHVDVIDMKSLKENSLGIDPYSWLPIPRPVPGQPEPYFPMKAMRSVLAMQDLFTKDGDPPRISADRRSAIPVFVVTSAADSIVDSEYASRYLGAVATNVTQSIYTDEKKIGHSFENVGGNPEFTTLADQISHFLN